MLCGKVLILSVIISIGEAFIYEYQNTYNNFGEKCLTKNNEPGYCEELLKCDHAQQLYKSGRASEINLCKYIGNTPFVCCPSISKLSYLTQPAKKSSSKFQKALCKNVKSSHKIDNHIINGVKADVGEFPFQVVIGYNSEDGNNLEFNCGGSLIADDIVLTAAHCVNKKDRAPIMVRLGRTSLDLNDDDDEAVAQDIEIETISIHPKYSRKTRHNDIALIKLQEPVTLSHFVGTICLSTSDTNLPKDFTVTGFGEMSSSHKMKSDWLLKGKVNEYPFDKCNDKVFNTYGIKNMVIDSQFCAISDKGVDTCRGDSGGPLVYEQSGVFYLHGITSFGIACGSSYPAMYTRVNKYLDWIETEMSSFESKFRSF